MSIDNDGLNLCPGECKMAVCPVGPVLEKWLEDDDPFKTWLILGKALDVAARGIKYHPDMAGNKARILGYVQNGVSPNYPNIGDLERQDILSRVAECVANQCAEQPLPQG